MSHLLAQLKISARIYLIIGIIVIGIGSIIFVSSNALKDSLYQQRSNQIQNLVETAESLVQGYQARVEAGELTEEEAKGRAKSVLGTLHYEKTNYFWINDIKGKLLMHPSLANLIDTDVKELKDAKGNKIFNDMINLVKEKGAGEYRYSWPPSSEARPKMSYVQGNKKWGWIIGTGVFFDDLEKEVWAIQKAPLITGAIALFLATFLAIFIGRSISKPVVALTHGMQELADGHLDTQLHMENRRDEIGDMARTFETFQEGARQVKKMTEIQQEKNSNTEKEKKAAMNLMANEFEESVGKSVTVVASAATDLQESSKMLLDISEQTSRQTSTVAAATEEASSSVQTVASAAEELSASIGEINRQIEESSRVSKDAVNKVKETDETVSTLSEAATQIGDVVKLIQDIAEQTNLLALNATIEAARAGEAGKGFAVVASEVKNLATQTGKATEEISAKIITVQDVSNASVSAIRGIGKIIEQIDDITQTIAEALHQQDEATKEISNNVQQASAGTSEISSSITTVTQAAQESRMAATEVMGASEKLSSQSESLRSEIEGFLVKIRQG